MNIFCNTGIVSKLASYISPNKSNIGNSCQSTKVSASETLNSNAFLKAVLKNKENPVSIIKMINKNPSSSISNLLVLEEALNNDELQNAIKNIKHHLIDTTVNEPKVKAYFYYLKLKIDIINHDKSISIENLLNKSYDFSVDRLIDEFVHNMICLKNLHKFIIYEDHDDKSMKEVVAKRAVFFEWLSLKMFLLLVYFSCNSDLCKDNKYLIHMVRKVKEYNDLNKWYLLNMGSFDIEVSQRDLLKNYIENYTCDLLVNLKLFAYNKEKGSSYDKALSLFSVKKILAKVFKEHKINMFQMNQEFENFSARMQVIKRKHNNLNEAYNPIMRKVTSDTKLRKVLEDISEESIEYTEFDDTKKVFVGKHAFRRYATMGGPLTDNKKQLSQLQTIDFDGFKFNPNCKTRLKLISRSKANKKA